MAAFVTQYTLTTSVTTDSNLTAGHLMVAFGKLVDDSDPPAAALPLGWSHVSGSPVGRTVAGDGGQSSGMYVAWKIATSSDVSTTLTGFPSVDVGRLAVFSATAGYFDELHPVTSVYSFFDSPGTPETLAANDFILAGTITVCANSGANNAWRTNNGGGPPSVIFSATGGASTSNRLSVFYNFGTSIDFQYWFDFSGNYQARAYDGLSLSLNEREAAPGTTDDAIATGGTPLALVAQIEGYPAYLTNWHDADAVRIAYAEPGVTVIQGMSMQGEFTQEIRPLDPQFDFGTIALRVLPDSDDVLAKDVWSAQRSTGQSTVLTSSVDPDDTTLNVLDATWTGQNVLYIGTEAITYVSPPSGTSFAVSAGGRGRDAPFTTSTGAKFARSHVVNSTQGAATYRPTLTDWKRVWIGSHVAIRLHKADGNDLNTKANARLLFAGTIADLQDDEDGSLVIVCTDIREVAGNQLLLADQWSAAPGEGFAIGADEQVTVFMQKNTSSAQQVIAISAGEYTADGLVNAINAGLTAEADYEFTAAVDPVSHFQARLRLTSPSSPAADLVQLIVFATRGVADALGFELISQAPDEAPLGYASFLQGWTTDVDPEVVVTSPERVAHSSPRVAFGSTIPIQDVTGVFVPQGDTMPVLIRTLFGTDAGGDFGFLQYDGKHTFLVKKTSDTELVVYWDERLVYALLGATGGPILPPIVRRDAVLPRFKQVIVLESSLGDFLPRLFASTGASGFNHPTYDAWDRQLGAGVPWELMGDTFLESVNDLCDANDATIVMYLDRPTQLRDVVTPELALRNAHLVFRGGLVFRRSSGDVVTADHAVTDSNLVGGPDDYQTARPVVNWSRGYLVNSVKVEFSRTVEDKYLDSVEVRNSTSIEEYGMSAPVTIRARNNHYRGRGGDFDAIYSALEGIAADILAVYDEPLRVVSMPVDGVTISSMAPGDSVALSSSFLRNPTSGTRGLTGALGYVLRTSFDFARLRGDVDILLTGAETARAASLSPAAKVDETANTGGFTAGYDSGGPTIKLKQNEFSATTEDDDVTHFAVSDAVKVIEKSPATPASPQSWTTTIDSISGDDVTLAAALTGFDSAKEYYLVSDDYANAVASQQVDTYLADDVDDQVNDAEQSRTWRTSPPYVIDSVDALGVYGAITELYEHPPTDGSWWNELEPIHPAMLQAMLANVNGMLYQRSALAAAWWLPPGGKQTSSASYEGLFPPFRVHVSPGVNRRHTLTLGLFAAVSSASTGTIRVSTWRSPPRAPSDLITMNFGDQPVRVVEFTTTSTAGENIATQDLDLNLDESGATWLTVEAKNSAAANTLLYGFHTWHVTITP